MTTRAARRAATSGPASGDERPGERLVVQACHAVGCAALILPEEVFCKRHASLLQGDIRTLVERTYRPHRRPSKIFLIHLARAQQEILYAQTEGHRAPREAEFEWFE